MKRCFYLLLCPLVFAAAQSRQEIDKGLVVSEYTVKTSLFGKASIVIIKIDPRHYEFTLLTSRELGHEPLTIAEWAERYQLLGAINAGMYQEDGRRHVGFLKSNGRVHNSAVNSYLSVLAFHPVVDTLPPIHIFDLDERPLGEITVLYRSVMQNLRLIKRPGINRWFSAAGRWCEAALGQDVDGNILFIYSPTPMTMTRLNQALLELPIGLVAAQHLEGGPPASLYFSHAGKTIHYVGGENRELSPHGAPQTIPNV
ncbi:MAG: phosphodiester glycosidase family protein, partial [candidate division KSB1 bacterium]|nr:phosphodiester glycosidase family protein [candidate division KSB1 bacterium]